MLCEINCVIFGVHYPLGACTCMHKSISIHYGIKFNEIYTRYSDAQRNRLFRKWVYIAEIARAQAHTENINILQPTKKKKSVLAWHGSQIKSNNIQYL